MPKVVRVPKTELDEIRKDMNRVKTTVKPLETEVLKQLEDIRKRIDRIELNLETLEDEDVMKQIAESKRAIERGEEQDWKEVDKELEEMDKNQ